MYWPNQLSQLIQWYLPSTLNLLSAMKQIGNLPLDVLRKKRQAFVIFRATDHIGKLTSRYLPSILILRKHLKGTVSLAKYSNKVYLGEPLSDTKTVDRTSWVIVHPPWLSNPNDSSSSRRVLKKWMVYFAPHVMQVIRQGGCSGGQWIISHTMISQRRDMHSHVPEIAHGKSFGLTFPTANALLMALLVYFYSPVLLFIVITWYILVTGRLDCTAWMSISCFI